MKDLRDLLLIDKGYGNRVRDNDALFEGSERNAQGALVIGTEGSIVIHVGPLQPRVVIPEFDCSVQGASMWIDRMLWISVKSRENMPVVPPGKLVSFLQAQLIGASTAGEVVHKLYAKPGTLAWDRAQAECEGLPVIEALSGLDDVVLGLPPPEALGVSLQASAGSQGLAIFPRLVAAVKVT
jgi:hypothetical protein